MSERSSRIARDPDPFDTHPVRVQVPSVDDWVTLETAAALAAHYRGVADGLDEAIARIAGEREAGVTVVARKEVAS